MNTSELLNLPRLESDLSRVESALLHAVESEDPMFSEVARHLVTAGGKRLRPTLALLAGSLSTGNAPVPDGVISGAVAVELVHLGSLYHDDVMDEAATRRNVESVNARWGNLTAILAGDYLLAKSSEIAATLGTEIAGLLATTIGRLCEGQARELQQAFNVERTQTSYFRALEGKTAALTSTSCRIGALTARLDRSQVEDLTRFGFAFGMAFQIRDDILDVISTDAQLGKPAGNDLAEGIYTLPTLLALAGSDVSDELFSLLGSSLGDAERDRARKLVRASGGIDRAWETARDYVEESTRCLDGLGDREGAENLRRLARNLVEDVPVTV